MPSLKDSIGVFQGSQHYSDLLDSFSPTDKPRLADGRNVSEAIFFHVCKMKNAGWRHKIEFERMKKHSFSEFFHDIVAFYLKAALPEGFGVKLEAKENKTQVDIAIKRGGKYTFLIEVKTNLGWSRPAEHTAAGEKAIEAMHDRVNELISNFKVPEKNIIYIIEEVDNVGKDFEMKYWDNETKARRRPLGDPFPFPMIYPLFYEPDPYYWRWEDGFDKDKHYKTISDTRIRQEARDQIVTPFEDILNRITASASIGDGGRR